MPLKRSIIIAGSGPAALMAADVLTRQGCAVQLVEKKKGPGKKLLIAGSSGLNITYDDEAERFHLHYRQSAERMRPMLEAFPPEKWIAFINELGLETFKGTSRRYFVKEMKASGLLRAWLKRLAEQGATIEYSAEATGFERKGSRLVLKVADGRVFEADAICFALGGASWEPAETPLRWPRLFTDMGIGFEPFTASNVGYELSWPEAFIKAFEGQPLKNIAFTTSLGTKRGDLMVTGYGLEGTPVYFLGTPGIAHLDLKPDLSLEQIQAKLESVKENRHPVKRAKKTLNLPPASQGLLAHVASPENTGSIEALAQTIKRFPLMLERPRPLQEAISSKGGLKWDELDSKLMLKKHPGVFAAGEMIDWDAPTGGFLIQGCVSQGFYAAQGILTYLAEAPHS